ncbi:mitochondrial carrier domain-containing protein [Glomus cerebriforme]|uniref:Mitochondrial thiamine pyrophosphate carrier 1 n=1 Tax=Glomus cerebriforme TaxID=658196 RepID=A0A397TKD5_9GLOM|nr:mitochondrial carrier domain-containing protein [Glomus cerebriforme]
MSQDLEKGYEHETQYQSRTADQAVVSPQLSSIEIGICGAVAGMVSRFVASPLDVVKIRLQLQPGRPISPLSLRHQSIHVAKKYNGMFHAIKLIVREEGIRGLWNGNLSAEYLYLSYGAVQFLTYQQMQNLFKRIDSNQNGNYGINKTLQPFLSGAICGSTATIVTYPFDLLRTRFAAQRENRVYLGLRHAVQQIYAQEGYSGFYRGVTASVAQIIPYMGLMFGNYEFLKKSFRKLEDKHIWFHNLRGVEDLLSGAISGIISKAGVFPLDLVRKILQVQGPNRTNYFVSNVPLYSSSIFICIRQILRNDGILGLYKGLTPALIKSAPVSAVTFFVYGYTKRLLESLHSLEDT